MKRRKNPSGPVQLSLPLESPRTTLRGGLRVIPGGGQARRPEALSSPDAVARLLVEAGADLLLRRITPERAQTIERAVNKVLALFERVEASPSLAAVLERELDELEALMTESRTRRRAR